MSMPSYVDLDRRLPGAEAVREALESRTLGPFEDDERLGGDHLRAAAEDTDSSIADWVDRDRYSSAEEGADLRSFG